MFDFAFPPPEFHHPTTQSSTDDWPLGVGVSAGKQPNMKESLLGSASRIGFRALLLLVVPLAALLSGPACDPARQSCRTTDDCYLNPNGEPRERCSPTDTFCKDGSCLSDCAKTCSVDLDGVVSPCDTGLICNLPMDVGPSSPTFFHCTRYPIACKEAANCPLVRPGTGAWTCVEGLCRFPGFSYVIE